MCIRDSVCAAHTTLKTKDDYSACGNKASTAAAPGWFGLVWAGLGWFGLEVVGCFVTPPLKRSHFESGNFLGYVNPPSHHHNPRRRAYKSSSHVTSANARTTSRATLLQSRHRRARGSSSSDESDSYSTVVSFPLSGSAGGRRLTRRGMRPTLGWILCTVRT